MQLLVIDPGANSGFARFDRRAAGDWRLVSAMVASPEVRSLDQLFAKPDIVVIENPQIYPHSRARPADILKLARIVGRYEERFADARQMRLVHPHEWKGSIAGDIMVERIPSGDDG